MAALTSCELLELDRASVDDIARTHPRVRDVLENAYIERASSPEVAAVRAVVLPEADTRRRAWAGEISPGSSPQIFRAYGK